MYIHSQLTSAQTFCRRWPNLLMSCAHHLTLASVCGGLSCFSGWQAQPPMWCREHSRIHAPQYMTSFIGSHAKFCPWKTEPFNLQPRKRFQILVRDFSAWLDHQHLPMWWAALSGATSESSPLSAILTESYFIVFNFKECVISRAFSWIYLLASQALQSAVCLYHSNNILNLHF